MVHQDLDLVALLRVEELVGLEEMEEAKMSLYQDERNACLSAQPGDSDCRLHGLVYRRVFRIACEELPRFQSDLENMTADQAKDDLCERIEMRYRAQWRVEDGTRDGPYGFIVTITLAVVLLAVILAVVSWLVKRLLDRLFPLNTLAVEALQWVEPEYPD